jgi:hypothetical protein
MAARYSSAVPATTLTDITGGGVASNAAGAFVLTLTNRGAVDRAVRVAVTSGDAPGNGDYIEYDTVMEGSGVLSRWPIPLSAGWKVYVYANGTGISATLIGLERV